MDMLERTSLRTTFFDVAMDRPARETRTFFDGSLIKVVKRKRKVEEILIY